MSEQHTPDNQPTASMQPGNGGGDVPPTVPMSNGGGSERPGDWIGPYKLLDIIGEGGFGTVWLAERRGAIVQRVALKIIKQGMDTKAVIARFEQERQALAVMDHPHVAKVFDAGATPSGRPYFVMEHVPGEPITDYADRQNLSVRDRLELFIPVCEAIQHAHHKGIIHRDIKPSNILVTVRDSKPLPKIIDFGVAKAISHTLTEKTIFTEQGMLIGTPEYMSPEQAEMGATDIDTRTDVYSLGVVLYELLSGLLPFDSKSLRSAGYDAIRKVLREQDAPKPSTRLSSVDDATGADIALHRVAEREHLTRELKRELDWIPLKALRKDRTARYDTPADLAKDIQRYIDGQPLEAGPEATSYRVKKYIRRNKGPVAAAAAVFVALSLGLLGTAWGWTRAAASETRASADAARARMSAEQEKQARSDMTKLAIDSILANGQVYAARGETSQAIRHFRDAYEKSIANSDMAPTQLIMCASYLGNALCDNGDFSEAEPLFREVADRTGHLLGDEHPDAIARMSNLGNLLLNMGRLGEAEPILRGSLEKSRTVVGEMHPSTTICLVNLALLFRQQGRLEMARVYYKQAYETRQSVLGVEHPDTLAVLRGLIICLMQMNEADADSYSERLLVQSQRVLGPRHPVAIRAMVLRADVLATARRFNEADIVLRNAIDQSRCALGDEHPDTLNAMGKMGVLLRDQGKVAEAEPYVREALEISRRVLGEEHPSTLACISNMGVLLRAQSKYAEAEPYLREALEKSRRVLGEEHPSTRSCIEALVALYTGWHAAEPGKGYEAKATAWKAKLPPTESSAEPSDGR